MIRVIIRYDGYGAGRCLYTELIPLQTLGVLTMRRATRIEFHEKTQKWRVWDRSGHSLFESSSRGHCLQWEEDHSDQLLGEP